jgi:hypothetical protein
MSPTLYAPTLRPTLMFIDANRRRDDFEHHDAEVRPRRGVVRTHTIRAAPAACGALSGSGRGTSRHSRRSSFG